MQPECEMNGRGCIPPGNYTLHISRPQICGRLALESAPTQAVIQLLWIMATHRKEGCSQMSIRCQVKRVHAFLGPIPQHSWHVTANNV